MQVQEYTKWDISPQSIKVSRCNNYIVTKHAARGYHPYFRERSRLRRLRGR